MNGDFRRKSPIPPCIYNPAEGLPF